MIPPGKVGPLGGSLQGHPDMDMTPGIEAVTASLGQGLSVSLGMALGLALDGSDSRVYTILGDGELSEGQVWEAAIRRNQKRGGRAYPVDGSRMGGMEHPRQCGFPGA